jgi:hypothetical protein
MRLTVLFAWAICAVLTVACGRATPDAASAPGDRPAVDGPQPTATAEPTQTGRPLIRSSLTGTCRLTPTGAEIRVEYSATATGSTLLTRVRLLEDGRQVEDSGEIEQRQYRRSAVYRVDVGEQRTYRLATETPSGPGSNVQTTVRCGTTASPTPAPRA